MSETVLLDPGSERDPSQREPRALPLDLSGRTVGLLDISKPRGDVFLDEIASLLEAEGATVTRFRKPTFTRPAPTELRQDIAEQCDLVLEGLAD
ncbi:MAG: hypothetical protein EA417_13065 [Gammaproteobacteria bacterium]|nr:MAG: hypothetical protein EA417_13065 [Gammaproteobacteria bacterium]